MIQKTTWAAREGTPSPLGVTWVPEDDAFNFAIYSKYAESVTVLLYERKDYLHPVFTYKFESEKNKTGRIWHARISKCQVLSAAYYAYLIDGPHQSTSRFERHAFHPEKILLDPYATSVFFPPEFDRAAAFGQCSNAGKAPLAVLPSSVGGDDFDWGQSRRPQHDSDMIIYEMHVRGFTKNPNSGVSIAKQGTFGGIIEKIPYLQELGITAVELMPIFQFDATEPNYWGYMPLNFFSPHAAYASQDGSGDQIYQFKEMVKALHEAKIEVILDVVYNHTGEGNECGPVYTLKAIDNSTYYMASDDSQHPYADFSGTGNTLHCDNRAVRQLVVNSLLYWFRDMHVDGFRFDMASIFSRKSDGSINLLDPPIFGDISGHPDLKGVRLIAEPWEGNDRYPNYQLGFNPGIGTQESALQRGFPGTDWRQWNDRFRTTVRMFIKSDPGWVLELMTRIYGSSDKFPDSLREAYRPWQSLNYISSHDGLTLYDLVAYDSPESWNCGEPDRGIESSRDVMALRKRQIKNFFCLLLLSNGTPMFRAGDEFMQSQLGSGNVYNLDDEQSWLNWEQLLINRDMFDFARKMIAFRKAHPSLGRSLFWRDEVRWYGVGREVDTSHESRSLAYCLDGQSLQDSTLYVMINAFWQPLVFTIQEGEADQWHRIVDTSVRSPNDFMDPCVAPNLDSLVYELQPRSVAILQKFPAAATPKVKLKVTLPPSD